MGRLKKYLAKLIYGEPYEIVMLTIVFTLVSALLFPVSIYLWISFIPLFFQEPFYVFEKNVHAALFIWGTYLVLFTGLLVSLVKRHAIKWSVIWGICSLGLSAFILVIVWTNFSGSFWDELILILVTGAIGSANSLWRTIVKKQLFPIWTQRRLGLIVFGASILALGISSIPLLGKFFDFNKKFKLVLNARSCVKFGPVSIQTPKGCILGFIDKKSTNVKAFSDTEFATEKISSGIACQYRIESEGIPPDSFSVFRFDNANKARINFNSLGSLASEIGYKTVKISDNTLCVDPVPEKKQNAFQCYEAIDNIISMKYYSLSGYGESLIHNRLFQLLNQKNSPCENEISL
jgi:hypothetical protein